MAIFKGAGVAIATPMKENLEVNYDKLDEMLEEQIAGGTDAIIICGTTGESATMTEEEHAATIRFAIERVNHRIPVIAGTGSNCTRTAIQLSKEAQEDGADGLLLVTPYYNKATQNGLIAHYTAICNEVNIPAILYNVPSRTGCGLQPQTVATLVKVRSRSDEIPSLASLYLSSLNQEQGKQISGFEPRAIEMLRQYEWPNNYTQFKNLLRSLASLTTGSYIESRLVAELLAKERAHRNTPSSTGVPVATDNRTLEEINQEIVQQAVAAHGGNRAAAARQLGISRTTLWRYLSKSEE